MYLNKKFYLRKPELSEIWIPVGSNLLILPGGLYLFTIKLTSLFRCNIFISGGQRVEIG